MTIDASQKIHRYLSSFTFVKRNDLFSKETSQTKAESVKLPGGTVVRYVNEFWTAKQRQANKLHEISYRGCFKPQLPRFFIELLTKPGDVVYDPFSGRGTTAIEAALLDREVIANDINPLSRILCRPRLFAPDQDELEDRLAHLPDSTGERAEIDLSMFYHPVTEAEIVSLKNYLSKRSRDGSSDRLDDWIRMVATNRLTGHSNGFFSVYTLPPNQAASAERQRKINEKRNQIPEYRSTRQLIARKSKALLSELTPDSMEILRKRSVNARFLTCDARRTTEIPDASVNLTVTSPPFLKVVQYDADNWLRCWFNDLNSEQIARELTMVLSLGSWEQVMAQVFSELFRITCSEGYVAFEVGEVERGAIRLDETVVPLGISAGFTCECIIVNQQTFTKTANIWGISNNEQGTNSNRIVLFRKR